MGQRIEFEELKRMEWAVLVTKRFKFLMGMVSVSARPFNQWERQVLQNRLPKQKPTVKRILRERDPFFKSKKEFAKWMQTQQELPHYTEDVLDKILGKRKVRGLNRRQQKLREEVNREMAEDEVFGEAIARDLFGEALKKELGTTHRDEKRITDDLRTMRTGTPEQKEVLERKWKKEQLRIKRLERDRLKAREDRYY